MAATFSENGKIPLYYQIIGREIWVFGEHTLNPAGPLPAELKRLFRDLDDKIHDLEPDFCEDGEVVLCR